jgi:hypothetical protein
MAGADDVERRKILTLPALKLRPLGRPAHSQSLYRLRYPGSLLEMVLCCKKYQGLKQICVTKDDDKTKKLLLEITISHSTIIISAFISNTTCFLEFLSSAINICTPLPLISHDV